VQNTLHLNFEIKPERLGFDVIADLEIANNFAIGRLLRLDSGGLIGVRHF